MDRRAAPDLDAVLLLAPTNASRGEIRREQPDRAEQERAHRQQRVVFWAKPVAMGALAPAAVAFVVAPTHPVSIALYVVGAVGFVGALMALGAAGRRLLLANAYRGVPVPPVVAETALETQLHLIYLEEEVTYWGATGLRRRLRRELRAFEDAASGLRTAWLKGDEQAWRRAGDRVEAVMDGMDQLSVDVSLLPYRGA